MSMAKRVAELFVAFELCVFLFAFEINGREFSFMPSRSTGEQPVKYVIFDTDMGGDDAWALQMILKAEKQLQNVKLLAITTTFGNTDVINAIKNTYRILDGLSRTDIPIYKGASEAIIPIDTKKDNFFGANGFSNIDIWEPYYPPLNSIVQKKNAIEIIRDLVMQYPHKISLLCLAPLTNIALAIKSHPEIQQNIKEVISMGGSITGRGNIVPAAEFNYYMDPEAVFIILNSSIRPIWNFPLDAHSLSPISTKWRFEVLGKVKSPNVQLLNEIEILPYRNETDYGPYDAFTTAAFLFPKKIIQKWNPYHALMELHGYDTRGEMIVNRKSTDYNVFVVEQFSGEEFKRIMLWAATNA